MYVGFTCSTVSLFEGNRYEGNLVSILALVHVVTLKLGSVESDTIVVAILGKVLKVGGVVGNSSYTAGDAKDRIVVLIFFLVVGLVHFLIGGQNLVIISDDTRP